MIRQPLHGRYGSDQACRGCAGANQDCLQETEARPQQLLISLGRAPAGAPARPAPLARTEAVIGAFSTIALAFRRTPILTSTTFVRASARTRTARIPALMCVWQIWAPIGLECPSAHAMNAFRGHAVPTALRRVAFRPGVRHESARSVSATRPTPTPRLADRNAGKPPSRGGSLRAGDAGQPGGHTIDPAPALGLCAGVRDSRTGSCADVTGFSGIRRSAGRGTVSRHPVARQRPADRESRYRGSTRR